jgi:hypothetical protein
MSASYADFRADSMRRDEPEQDGGALALTAALTDLTLTEPPRRQPATLYARQSGSGVTVLRNNGGKPLQFHGVMIAEGSSRGQGALAWHEVAIYRTESGSLAVAIRFMRAGSGECGVHRARIFERQDGALSWLEDFDPACDLSADFDVSDRRSSAATVALKAAFLRDRAERLERDYRALVGEMLFRLETES